MEGNSKIQEFKNLLLRRERKDTTFESIDKESSPDSQSGKILETPRLLTERIGNVFKRPKERESSGRANLFLSMI